MLVYPFQMHKSPVFVGPNSPDIIYLCQLIYKGSYAGRFVYLGLIKTI